MQDREKIEHIFIDIRSKRNDLSYRFIKRLFDIVASISALLLLTPVFLILILQSTQASQFNKRILIV